MNEEELLTIVEDLNREMSFLEVEYKECSNSNTSAVALSALERITLQWLEAIKEYRDSRS